MEPRRSPRVPTATTRRSLSVRRDRSVTCRTPRVAKAARLVGGRGVAPLHQAPREPLDDADRVERGRAALRPASVPTIRWARRPGRTLRIAANRAARHLVGVWGR